MRQRTSKRLWIALGAAGILLAIYLLFELAGSVVLFDNGGQVDTATLVAGNGATQPMYRIPGGLFVAVPRIEGEIAIRCRDGSVGHGGYVTPHADARVKVMGACRIAAR